MKSFTKHNDYLKELSKCHSSLINSRHKTSCISIARLMAHMGPYLLFFGPKIHYKEIIKNHNSCNNQMRRKKLVKIELSHVLVTHH